VPLKAMGRFEHETAPVDPKTGIVYITCMITGPWGHGPA
jgi:secreted PhoX family phosphatase